MNNTVTNKIKHFPQLFALGPQAPLKKLLQFPPYATISTQLDIYFHKYKDAKTFQDLLQGICLVKKNYLIGFLA